MTDLRKAAEMALEQIELSPTRKSVHEVTQALRQALAQPEREWVGLTDEEIEVIAKKLMDDAAYCSLHFAVAIGAALRKKNT